MVWSNLVALLHLALCVFTCEIRGKRPHFSQAPQPLGAAAAQLLILSEENPLIPVASWFQFMESQQEGGISMKALFFFLL